MESSSNSIAATTTQTGLKVKAEPDSSHYEKALKPGEEQMASIKLIRAQFHGDWNYTIQP